MKNMKIQGFRGVAATCVLLAAVQMAAADPLQDMEDCKGIMAEGERLACFDAAAGQLRAAGMTADSVLKSKVIEKEVPEMPDEVESGAQSGAGEETRSRFKIPFFGNKEPRDDVHEVTDQSSKRPSGSLVERDSKGNVSSVESTVTSLRKNSFGYTTLTLANGQRWQTKESRIRAAVGDSVRIRRTRLGGYFLAVGGKSGLRVKRLDSPSPTTTPKDTDSRTKRGGLFSRLNPFDNEPSESPAEEPAIDDPNFGKHTRDLSSAGAFGSVKTTKAERAAEQQTMKQTVSRVGVDPYDKFIITLGNGQVWRQTAGHMRIRDDDTVIIRRAALGSYLLKVEGRNLSVRVKRVDE